MTASDSNPVIVTDHIKKTLSVKSRQHQGELRRLKKTAEDAPLSKNVTILESRPQVVGVNTIILDPDTDREDFIFYFDRMVVMLIERHVHPPLHKAHVANANVKSDRERHLHP